METWVFLVLVIAIGIWEAFWTYKACWLAAELKEKPAFIFFLLFSLLGIPEIVYLYRKRRLPRLKWKNK